MAWVPSSLERAIEALVEVERGIDGIAEVYLYQPEAMVLFPCVLNYPIRGMDVREEASTIRSLYTLGVELHVTRQVLPDSERLCRAMLLRFADAIWADPTWNRTITTVNQVRHALTPFLFNREIHAGIRFEVDIKMRRAVAI